LASAVHGSEGRIMRACFVIAGLAGLAAASAARADAGSVTILFHVRPPHAYYDSAHEVAGLLVAPVKAAMTKGHITADWVEMPPARQTEEIKCAIGAVCGLGWFKEPDREAFALFSVPIYHDQPTVVVARQNDARFSDGMTLQDSFRDPSRTLLVKTGYSYGPTIDEWIKALQPHAETSAEANEMLLGMIAQRRADYAIMAPEEANDLLATMPQLAALRVVRLSDAPQGELRYLMCSRATPENLITRVDEGLPPVTPE
jgi:ABC-type amino acid transport substrate-binding protein